MLARENFDDQYVWHNERTVPQDAQTGRSARPQRMKARGVPLGYVEGLNDARTLLADCFSILLENTKANRHPRWLVEAIPVGLYCNQPLFRAAGRPTALSI
jgi:hypothetical protein